MHTLKQFFLFAGFGLQVLPFVFLIIKGSRSDFVWGDEFVGTYLGNWYVVIFLLFFLSFPVMMIGTRLIPILEQRRFENEGQRATGRILSIERLEVADSDEQAFELALLIVDSLDTNNIKNGVVFIESDEENPFKVGAEVAISIVDGEEEVRILGLIEE